MAISRLPGNICPSFFLFFSLIDANCTFCAAAFAGHRVSRSDIWPIRECRRARCGSAYVIRELFRRARARGAVPGARLITEISRYISQFVVIERQARRLIKQSTLINNNLICVMSAPAHLHLLTKSIMIYRSATGK